MEIFVYKGVRMCWDDVGGSLRLWVNGTDYMVVWENSPTTCEVFGKKYSYNFIREQVFAANSFSCRFASTLEEAKKAAQDALVDYFRSCMRSCLDYEQAMKEAENG